jgi:hypothetical protein
MKQTVLGFEYRSPLVIGGWPLLHICVGVDPQTMRPRVAKGIIAIGNIAVGGAAFRPSIIDGRRRDPQTVELVRQWLRWDILPPHCR